MHALPVEGLSKSLQDAILLTRALGIQYIWIDSLCIIQDCDEDKHREMARMANIYKNAIFTISAARAKSCDEGFLGVQDKRVLLLRDSIQLPINCLNGAIGSVLLYPTRTQFGREDTPIDKRAWTYQEQVLSRRVVSFFDNAIEWTCPSCDLSDDRLGINEIDVTNPAYTDILAPLSGRMNYVSKVLYMVSGWRNEFLETLASLHIFWWRAVYEYTLGSLSNLDDRLPAIAGIATEFQILTGDVYIAGLWESHLISDLQWYVVPERLEALLDNTGNKDFKYDAPTWTWASVHESTIRGLRSGRAHNRLDSDRVEIIDCKVNLVSPSAPFGSVNGGELKIRAPLKFLSHRQIKEMALCYGVGNYIGAVFFDWISWPHTIALTTLRGRAAPDIESTGVWCLGLSKHADLNYEFSGLTLAKRADGLFERIGVFQIYVGDDWLKYGAAEKHELRASWGDDYVVTTVTIV
jgi:hypothetical protein